MADKQISQLVAATTLNNEDLLVIQQGQIAKKLSGERLAMFVYLAAGSMIDEVNSAVEEAQAAVDELLEEKNAIAQTIADMAGLGTDTTLTTPAMAADSKAVGDRIADVEKDALAGLNQKTISDVAIASFDDGADDAPVKELIVNIDPMQEGSGDPSPENVRQISGWTGCEVKKTGKNLYPYTTIPAYGYAWYSGSKALADATNPVFLKGGAKYAVSADQSVAATTSAIVRAWRADGTILENAPNVLNLKDPISGTTAAYQSAPKYYQLSTPNYAKPFTNIIEPTEDLWIDMRCSGDSRVGNDPMIQIGDSRTNYEPYQGTTLPVAFPSEAGTVYGAKLNLTTGKLIVDTAARQFDGSGDVYSFVSNGRVNIDFSGIDYKKGLDKDSGISNLYAGLMQTANNANFDSSAINYASCYNISSSANNFTVRIKDPRFVDLNTAQGILEEEPLVIIFNLNTPIVYNLTPIEVRTLLKINNIWANTGNINTLIYRTIPITEEVIREIMGDYEEIIAGVESTGKATKNYYAGNLVIVDDILYKCLVNVASGETFTPGAGGNVSQTTIADELATLQALYDNLGNLALLSYTTA